MLAYLKHFFEMRLLMPGEIRSMKEPIRTVYFNKCAIRHQMPHNAFNDVANFNMVPEFLLLSLSNLLQNLTPAHNNAAALWRNFENIEFVGFATENRGKIFG